MSCFHPVSGQRYRGPCHHERLWSVLSADAPEQAEGFQLGEECFGQAGRFHQLTPGERLIRAGRRLVRVRLPLTGPR